MAGSYALYRCAVLSTSSGSLSGILDRDSPIQILHLNVFMEQQEFADGLEISNEEYCIGAASIWTAMFLQHRRRLKIY